MTCAKQLLDAELRAQQQLRADLLECYVVWGDPKKSFSDWKVIGSGGFGNVYSCKPTGGADAAAKQQLEEELRKQATTNSLNEVAIKGVSSATPGDRDRCEEEIATLIRCRHPNIVRLFQAYLHGGTYWLVMELCEGGSLQEFFLSNVLKEKEIAYVVREALKGLVHMHRQGMVHRDLKPDNIFLHISGDVKLGNKPIVHTHRC
jgi:serine/threonine protein kinase